ncbi:MAG: PIN domain-containing protein [Candidatus Acidulodesulfobacterium ferriphilum]|uniref:PIN domain-containing protein n=1 Tax=Candidatus Acidulodesulfobacterium ferriphilum TaxID=2597223 RepID=A0A519BBY1_9DELT|nr:MAG: PIN domain-containing protein [Candidatus Acidulodesulfobacterium ferriphilum]
MGEKTIRVFLDSNVIFSGIISDKGAPRIILDILSLRTSFVTGITGEYNLIEIERNINKKISDAMHLYKEYLPKVNLEIIKLPSASEIDEYSGHTAAKDIPVPVSAINGKADYLVTGDKKDFKKPKIFGNYSFQILNPSEFIDGIIPLIFKATKKN